MKFLDIVSRETIIAELESSDRAGAVRELVQVVADCGKLDPSAVDGVVRSILTRERTRGTTGFGNGVAAPHAKVAGLGSVVGAVGRSTRGIDFASVDREPVFGVFLILSPADQPEEHLHAMDLVFRHLQQEKFRRFLRQADDVDKILDLLREADESLLVR